MSNPHTPFPTGTIRGPWATGNRRRPYIQFAVRMPNKCWVYVQDQNFKAAERKAKETRDKIFQP